VRYLVISDLHSSWEALEAVLEAARGEYDRIVCCGDLAGYGPDPNPVIDWARSNLYAVIRGNHDRVCSGVEGLEWFNEVAQAASIWTMSRLSKENWEYLRALPSGPLTVDGFQLIHGSPLDEDEYLLSMTDARNVFSHLQTNLAFFGHTHLQGGFEWRNGQYRTIWRMELFQKEVRHRLDPDGAYLINPGSVGQPRDGDRRAAFSLFDSERYEIVHRRVEYDYEATRRKIEAAGLPGVLGSRLLVGR
jgi:diadenosine tetraphosphatase ApaH/serine/threonine PP2A family protein phosphatase